MAGQCSAWSTGRCVSHTARQRAELEQHPPVGEEGEGQVRDKRWRRKRWCWVEHKDGHPTSQMPCLHSGLRLYASVPRAIRKGKYHIVTMLSDAEATCMQLQGEPVREGECLP